MKSHKYKLATLVLSTGLLLGACGGDGEEQPPEEQQDDTTVEETEDTSTTEEGTESSEENPDDTSEEETSGDAADSEGSVEDNSSDGTGGSDDGETDSSGGDSESGSNDSESSSETAGSSGVAVLDELGSTPEEAVSSAQENFDGELTELELDEDNGEWVYKVHLENDSEEYEVELLAEDLSTSNEETESDDNNDTEDQFSYGDAIPHDEAVQTALDEVGGELEGWSLDKDDGQLEYDVEVANSDNGDDTDVTINAESGEVIEVDN